MRLKQIAGIQAGYPFRGKILENPQADLVVVQMKDACAQGGINWQSCLRTQLTGKRPPDWLQSTDILVAARGSHHYAVEVGSGFSHPSLKAVAAPHFFVVRLTRPDVLPRYLAWLLNQGPCQSYFQQNAEGTLTKSIRRSVLEETPVAIPPLAKQRAIVGMAFTLFQEQKLAEKLLRNGERMMTAIAHELLNQNP
ncbi:MAG: restriction endonuclease subunit S [Limnobacter sp.]|nr:restriction endonuclease subunit S [Limnobacter sp.]